MPSFTAISLGVPGNFDYNRQGIEVLRRRVWLPVPPVSLQGRQQPRRQARPIAGGQIVLDMAGVAHARNGRADRGEIGRASCRERVELAWAAGRRKGRSGL